MSPLILDRIYIKTEKSRSTSEFLFYHYLWVTEVDAFSLSSFNCPTNQQLHTYRSSNIGNSNRYDYSDSSKCRLLCIRTNHHVLDVIPLCLHISASVVAAAKPSVAAACAMKTGKEGICRAVEGPVPTSHEGKATSLIMKLKSLAAEKLLFQAQYFSPEQRERSNSKATCWV